MRCLLIFLIPVGLFAQPFTKSFLLAFHTCTSNCAPQFHQTHIAESNDGLNWTMVPNLPSLPGSVPDIVIRGSKLYLYNPGTVRRYDHTSNSWDAAYTNVSVTDSNGNFVSFVDPSPIIDSSGRIVLFFMNSTGIMGDPAQCSTYPCTKYFDSATEVPGSDGTQFILNSGHRLAVTINSGSASDPDVFFDGTKYVLYYSAGTNTKAFSSASLHGNYIAFSGLSNGDITNQGGIPCGHYNAGTAEYWTYVHSGGGTGVTEIRRVAHSNFNSTVNTFTTVISGSSIGLGPTNKCESPGFCVNEFLQIGTEEIYVNDIGVYPNPVSGSRIFIRDQRNSVIGVQLLSFCGEVILNNVLESDAIELGNLSDGIYFIRLFTANGTIIRKIILQRV